MSVYLVATRHGLSAKLSMLSKALPNMLLREHGRKEAVRVPPSASNRRSPGHDLTRESVDLVALSHPERRQRRGDAVHRGTAVVDGWTKRLHALREAKSRL